MSTYGSSNVNGSIPGTSTSLLVGGTSRASDGPTETSSVSSILDELTDARISVYIPILCFISLLMVVGTLGNMLVILTYVKRVEKSSTNLFIFCLAMFDIINCTVTLPLEIYDLANPYTNDNDVLCRFHKFVAFSADLSSGFIIVCISFDRYRRIARPHQGLSVRGSKFALASICTAAVFISALTFVIYGTTTVTFTTHPGIYGRACGISDSRRESLLPLVFNILILVCFLGGVIALFIVYTLLGIKVRRWNKGRKSKISGSNRYSEYIPATGISEETGTPDSPEPRQLETFAFIQTKDNESGPVRYPADDMATRDQLSCKRAAFIRELSRSLDRNNFIKLNGGLHANGTQTLPLRKANNAKRKPGGATISRKASIPKLNDLRRRMKVSRTTVMFISATIAFVASHIPYACIKLAYTIHPALLAHMTSVQHAAFLFAEYSFIVSYAVNPIIYSFMNAKYRRECKSFLLELARKVKCQSRKIYLR